MGKKITMAAGSLLPTRRSPKLLFFLFLCEAPKAPHSSDYAPYPKLDPNDVAPPPPPISDDASTTMLPEFNPYISPSPARKSQLLCIIRSRILSNFSVWLIDRFWIWGWYDGLCEGHAWEMGENGSRHRQEGSGSLREDKTVQFD